MYLTAELYMLDGEFGFPLDDSWIHLKFARNLASGYGLSYNPGEMVTGSTAPLWTALLSTAFLLPGPAEAWAKIFGAGCYLLAIVATWALARELGVRRLLAGLAAALTMTSGWMIWSALSGMEIPLFAFLSLSGMTLHCRERNSGKEIPFSLLVLALAALARPEGFLLIAAAIFDRLLGIFEAKEPDVLRARLLTLLKGLLLVAVIVVPTMIFYRVIGEGFLPTTYWAKARVLQRWAPSGEYLWVVAGIFYRAQPVSTLLALGGLVVLVREAFQAEGRGRLVVPLWALGLPLYYSFFTLLGNQVLVGNFGRYYFPMLPVIAIAAVVALDRLIGEVLDRSDRVSTLSRRRRRRHRVGTDAGGRASRSRPVCADGPQRS